jgi:DNA-binding LytR/AlgR family response regulator
MYPDLALFIDVAQERVLKAIDGEHSAGEILQSAAMGDEEGRQLLKRLWEHDLIVFDAKQPPT